MLPTTEMRLLQTNMKIKERMKPYILQVGVWPLYIFFPYWDLKGNIFSVRHDGTPAYYHDSI
jgi:hypothetical protein